MILFFWFRLIWFGLIWEVTESERNGLIVMEVKSEEIFDGSRVVTIFDF